MLAVVMVAADADKIKRLSDKKFSPVD